MIISIDGPIAAGKTTLARVLAALYDAQLIEEAYEEIPTLEGFYLERERYAVETEHTFIRVHARQLSDLAGDDRPAIVDFAFERDLVYARVTLSHVPDAFATWYEEWRALRRATPQPDCVILLHCPPEVLLQRIQRRARPYEAAIDETYLRDLDEVFTEVYREHPPQHVINVDSSAPVQSYARRSDIAALFAASTPDA